MDVFHVTDQLGKKLTDQRIIDYIQQALGEKRGASTMEVRTCLGRTVGEHTTIEMTGTYRYSLLSDILAVLTNLKCNVVVAEVRTHNMRVACVVHITDKLTSRPIEDPDRSATIKEQLSNVLKGNDDRKGVEIDFPMVLTHTERRLHQMMFADRDYEGPETNSLGEDGNPIITIDSCIEKGYSVVTILSKDRPKLLFDTVCTLTNMQYVVFHSWRQFQWIMLIAGILHMSHGWMYPGHRR